MDIVLSTGSRKKIFFRGPTTKPPLLVVIFFWIFFKLKKIFFLFPDFSFMSNLNPDFFLSPYPVNQNPDLQLCRLVLIVQNVLSNFIVYFLYGNGRDFMDVQ